MKNNIEIRILPMSKDEFNNKTINEIQNDYFLDSLIYENDGRYYCPNSTMIVPSGTLILFQYRNCIVASANLITIEDYKDNPIEGYYHKAYVLDKSTVKVFEPITKKELSSIIKTFKKFSQSKLKIDNKYHNDIYALIDKKIELLKDNNLNYDSNYIGREGTVKIGTQSYYERDPKAREECINHYGVKCQVCGFDFKEVYGEIGEGFIHVHHKIKISTSKTIHDVDPVNDLVPVCPNCHAMLHKLFYGKELTVEELKEILIKNRCSL